MNKVPFEPETDLLKSSYNFELPQHLIAQRPSSDPGGDKLLVYDQAKNEVQHLTYRDLPQLVPPRSTFIFNRSRVFPCRFFGKKPSGGKVEVFFLAPRRMNRGELKSCSRVQEKRELGMSLKSIISVFSPLKRSERGLCSVWAAIDLENSETG